MVAGKKPGPSRRSFLGSALAAAAVPSTGWAAAGAPTHLTGARTPQGAYVLVGLHSDGSQAFRLPLPGRGHAAAAHPTRAEAVAFARRPGTYALVIDCELGRMTQELHAPKGHHFYGHGAFSKDGGTLFTTENHIASGDGRIGIWDAADSYTRRGEMPSGGIGPHEMLRVPGQDILAVANGGIRTHPDQGRAKLNLDTMRPNLTIMTPSGDVLETATLPSSLHQSSLRHIAAFQDGSIAVAFQWQGDPFAAPPLAGFYEPCKGLRLITMADSQLRGLEGYAGSVAALNDGKMAITFPRGGLMQVLDLHGGRSQQLRQADICGVAAAEGFALAIDGFGHVHALADDGAHRLASHDLAFDNHLVRIA